MGVLRAGLVLTLALTSPLSSQVEAGDVAFTTNSPSTFYILNAQSATLATYDVGSFGGGAARCIVADPNQLNEFIIGGIGFIGRATVLGPANVIYQTITNTVLQPVQISFDSQGQLVVVDGAIDQIRRVDPSTGAVSAISSGNQPWGNEALGGAVDPGTDQVWVASSGLHRFSQGETTTITNGWPDWADLRYVARDPFSAGVFATVPTTNQVVRIAPDGSAIDLVPPSTMCCPYGLAVSGTGDLIVSSLASIVRIPNVGGEAQTVFTFGGVQIQGNQPPITGVAIAGTGVPFALDVATDPSPALVMALQNLPDGTFEGWTLASATTTQAWGLGPVLGIAPDALTLSMVEAFPYAGIGHPVHWVAGLPGVWPEVPLVLPLAGTPPPLVTDVDFVSLALDQSGVTLAVSNVVRIAWP